MAGIVVRAAVRGETDLQISADFFDALDKHVAGLIKKAEERAKKNGRKTLKPHDL